MSSITQLRLDMTLEHQFLILGQREDLVYVVTVVALFKYLALVNSTQAPCPETKVQHSLNIAALLICFNGLVPTPPLITGLQT